MWLPRLGYAVRQSSSACRLESIDPVTFLDRGGRACHIKSSRDALYFVRLSSEPPVKGVPGTRTWQPIAGCLGGQDNTRQTQTVITLAGPRPGGVQTPAYYHAGVRSGYAPDQPVSVIIVQTDRGARHCLGLVVGGLRDGSSPSGDIFVAGQNIIIARPKGPVLAPKSGRTRRHADLARWLLGASHS